MQSLIWHFSGTTTDLQLQYEKVSSVIPKPNFLGMGGVNKYFYDAFWFLWNSGMASKFNELTKKHKDYGLWVTGHSLGAALSSLASAKILKGYPRFTILNSAHYNYGQPRVGDQAFVDSHNTLLPEFWRVTHANDLVTRLPSTELGFYHHTEEAGTAYSMLIRLCLGLVQGEHDKQRTSHFLHWWRRLEMWTETGNRWLTIVNISA